MAACLCGTVEVNDFVTALSSKGMSCRCLPRLELLWEFESGNLRELEEGRVWVLWQLLETRSSF